MRTCVIVKSGYASCTSDNLLPLQSSATIILYFALDAVSVPHCVQACVVGATVFLQKASLSPRYLIIAVGFAVLNAVISAFVSSSVVESK